MAEHSPDAEFVSGMRVDHDGAQTHWAVGFHNQINATVAKSEREMRKEIGQRVIAPLEAAINKLNRAVNEIAAKQDAGPTIDGALLNYIRATVADVLREDAISCAAANKRFISLLIVEALAPLKKNMAEFETTIRSLVRANVEPR